MNNVRLHIAQVGGSAISSLATIAAWQENLDWALRVGASAVAIVAGVLTVISLLRRNRSRQP